MAEDFRTILTTYQDRVYNQAYRMLGNAEDAEEATQDIFLKIYKSLEEFRGESALSTWIYRIARNESINAVRKKVISGQPIEDTVIEAPRATRPDEQMGRKSERARLERCLAELDENYRTVLELRYLGERSYAEIGDTLDLPIGTVKSYIHRAKIELKRVMTRSKELD